jgi:hypothetical protein
MLNSTTVSYLDLFWVGDGGRTHNPRIHSAMLRH